MSTPNLEPVTPEVAPEPAVLPEQRYEYQPTDESGRPLGGLQVIVYRAPDELARKLAEQNTLLIRRLRTVTKEHRLGIKPNEVIPDDAERFASSVEFKPRELSAAERFEISQQLNDPEKFLEGVDRMLTAAVGVNAQKLTSVLNEHHLYIMQQRAGENYEAFTDSAKNNGFVDSQDSRNIMTNWMLKNELAPTVQNFNLAYSTLKEAGLLQEAPVVRQEPTPTPVAAPAPVVPPIAPVDSTVNSQPSVETPSRIVGDAQPQTTRQSHVPSGLNDRVSSSTGVATPSGDGLSLTLAQIDKMSADKLRPLLFQPAFRKHYDELLTEADKRRKTGQ